MGRFIAEFGGKYLEWSTVVDAPLTNLMDLAELKAYLKSEYGQSGLDDLPTRLARVEKQGTSALNGVSKADLLHWNRAGEGESHLTTEAEVVARYTEPGTGQSDETKLKPCPFCGFIPHHADADCIYPVDRARTVWNLNCYETGGGCSAHILGASPEDCIEKWNTRTTK
jgi:hypothetical protein